MMALELGGGARIVTALTSEQKTSGLWRDRTYNFSGLSLKRREGAAIGRPHPYRKAAPKSNAIRYRQGMG
jgi:hypothetical protein